MDIASLTLLIAAALVALLLLRVPIGFATGAVAVVFGVLMFGPRSLLLVGTRIYEMITNYTLIAVPLFILMGLVLERSGLTDELFAAMRRATRRIPGGLAVGTILVAAFLAAIVGVIGAEVVTLGLVALPALLKQGYDRRLASGLICASGSLGSLLPPSVLLVLFGVIANVSVSKLFVAAVVPGVLYVGLFTLYVIAMGKLRPALVPDGRAAAEAQGRAGVSGPLTAVAFGLGLFGAFYFGIATPTEIAAIGLLAAILIAVSRGRLTLAEFHGYVGRTGMSIGSIIIVFFGASTLVGYYNLANGGAFLRELIQGLPLSPFGIILVIMLIWFVLGMLVDFIAVLFLTVPIFLPIVTALGYDPIWFGILFCMNMQMSYLTPPFGPAAFYLKSVAPDHITLGDIFRGNLPFVAIQAFGLLIVAAFPGLVTWVHN